MNLWNFICLLIITTIKNMRTFLFLLVSALRKDSRGEIENWSLFLRNKVKFKIPPGIHRISFTGKTYFSVYSTLGWMEHFSLWQFSFRAGIPTMDAAMGIADAVNWTGGAHSYSQQVMLFVTFDVRNTFISVRCACLPLLQNSFHVSVYLLLILRDYLLNGFLSCEMLEGQRRMEST